MALCIAILVCFLGMCSRVRVRCVSWVCIHVYVRARVNDCPPVQVKEAFNAIDMCEEAIVKKAFTRANDCLKRAIELFKHTHSETVAKIRTNLNQVRNLMKYLSRMDSIRFSVTHSQTILDIILMNT